MSIYRAKGLTKYHYVSHIYHHKIMSNVKKQDVYFMQYFITYHVGRDSSVGKAIRYWLDGPGIEFRWWRDFPHLSRPALWPTRPPIQ